MDRSARIKVSVKVVETGSFSAASGRLGTPVRSRASTSPGWKATWGRLLNRTTRQVSTTQAGRACYEQCREILHNLEEVDGVVSGLSRQPRGSLRISAATDFASAHLVPLASDFRRTYAGVQVELMCAERLVDLVDERCDLAVRMTSMPDPDLIARPLARCRHVLVASPHHPPAKITLFVDCLRERDPRYWDRGLGVRFRPGRSPVSAAERRGRVGKGIAQAGSVVGPVVDTNCSLRRSAPSLVLFPRELSRCGGFLRYRFGATPCRGAIGHVKGRGNRADTWRWRRRGLAINGCL